MSKNHKQYIFIYNNIVKELNQNAEFENSLRGLSPSLIFLYQRNFEGVVCNKAITFTFLKE